MNEVRIRQHHSTRWEVYITNKNWIELKEYVYCDYGNREIAEGNARALAEFYNSMYVEEAA